MLRQLFLSPLRNTSRDKAVMNFILILESVTFVRDHTCSETKKYVFDVVDSFSGGGGVTI